MADNDNATTSRYAVWKFPIETTDGQCIRMPGGAQILSLQVQYGEPCLWPLVDTAATKVYRDIRVYGTDDPIVGGPGKFIDTYQLDGGSLVFHVFDYGEETSSLA